MNFCHSLWSKPFLNKGLIEFESILWLSALSVENLHRLNQSVILYGDKLSINIIKPIIPYDEFIEISVNDKIPSDCYAASKFYALQLMEPDDIHIDNDVFIESNICLDLLKNNDADLIVQLIYRVGQPKFESSLTAINYLKLIGLIPNELVFDKGYNNGILGVRNEALKDTYIKAYLDFLIENNEDFNITRRDGIIIDSFNEEVRLYNMSMLDGYDLKVFSLFGDISTDLGNSMMIPRANLIGYEHLCGPKTGFLEMTKAKLIGMNTKLANQIKSYSNSLLLKSLNI